MNADSIVSRNLWSPVGDMIAGASARGLCFLEWHGRGGVERIRERVQRRYAAPLTPGENPHLDRLESELGDYFDGQLRRFTVPLDLRGTSFERTVWSRLLAIPYGETRSYSEIAAAVGRPRACRAVGRANGANYVAIVVPCHRVVESSGRLRGYGGGLWRKRFLLELEHRTVGQPAGA